MQGVFQVYFASYSERPGSNKKHHSLSLVVVVPVFQDSGPDDAFCHHIGVTVGGRSPVLQVALALNTYMAGDADGGTTVGHT